MNTELKQLRFGARLPQIRKMGGESGADPPVASKEALPAYSTPLTERAMMG
jgi:hypothetical protein